METPAQAETPGPGWWLTVFLLKITAGCESEGKSVEWPVRNYGNFFRKGYFAHLGNLEISASSQAEDLTGRFRPVEPRCGIRIGRLKHGVLAPRWKKVAAIWKGAVSSLGGCCLYLLHMQYCHDPGHDIRPRVLRASTAN